MLKYFISAFFVFVIVGCEKENPVENLVPENQILNGSFKISHNPETPQEWIEEGPIIMIFENHSYHYTGKFADTTKGRGYYFKDGIQDKGNYSISDNTISLKDYAVTYGLGRPEGSPSLYLNGEFEIKMLGESIFFIQKSYGQTIIILKK